MRAAVATVIVAAGLVRVDAAQEQPRLQSDEKVTMVFTNADAIDVLKFIDVQTELEIRIASEVTERRPITLRVRDANLVELFETVIDLADLDYEVLDSKTARVVKRR